MINEREVQFAKNLKAVSLSALHAIGDLPIVKDTTLKEIDNNILNGTYDRFEDWIKSIENVFPLASSVEIAVYISEAEYNKFKSFISRKYDKIVKSLPYKVTINPTELTYGNVKFKIEKDAKKTS